MILWTKSHALNPSVTAHLIQTFVAVNITPDFHEKTPAFHDVSLNKMAETVKAYGLSGATLSAILIITHVDNKVYSLRVHTKAVNTISRKDDTQ